MSTPDPSWFAQDPTTPNGQLSRDGGLAPDVAKLKHMTTREIPDVGVFVAESVPDELTDDLRRELERAGLSVHYDRREESPFAAIEWVLPTLIVLAVSRKLFDAFLGELGKDLYSLVKSRVVKLVERTSGPEAEVKVAYVVSVSSPKKLSGRAPAVVSVVAVLGSHRARFFFETDCPAEGQARAVDSMFRLLADHYSGSANDRLAILFSRGPVLWGVLPLLFDAEMGEWRCLTEAEVRGVE
jgi:hypothetical protein